MRKRKRLLVLTPLLVLFLLTLWYFFGDDVRGIPFATVVQAPQWQTEVSHSDLQIRKVGGNENAFLIKPTERIKEFPIGSTDGAYLYEPASKQFRFVSQDFWERAGGEIKTCDQARAAAANFETYGWYPLTAERASRSGRTAVISAAGPFIPAIFSFPSGQATGRTFGMRYFEVFDPQKATTKSPVVRIGKFEDLHLCWTPDDDFVVIYSGYFTKLAVIDVTLLEENKTK
jgi:hypothetical protein